MKGLVAQGRNGFPFSFGLAKECSIQPKHL
jgi:hypothetical protein